jgi:hypothetical protein
MERVRREERREGRIRRVYDEERVRGEEPL